MLVLTGGILLSVTLGGRCSTRAYIQIGNQNKKYGISNETQDISDHSFSWTKCLNHRCMGLLLHLLSNSLEFRYACLDGLATRKYGYWNGRAVGGAVQFFVERRERDKARTKLVPNLMKKRVVTIEVKLPDGQTRKSEGYFWYLSLTNIGEEAANGVMPLVNVSGEFAGIIQLSIIGIHYKNEISVKSKLSSEAFDSKRERYALALLSDADIAKASLNVDGLGEGAFVLCFAMKYENQLCVPFAKSPIVLNFPVDVVLTVYSRAVGLPRLYLGTYTCRGNNWGDCVIEPMER